MTQDTLTIQAHASLRIPAAVWPPRSVGTAYIAPRFAPIQRVEDDPNHPAPTHTRTVQTALPRPIGFDGQTGTASLRVLPEGEISAGAVQSIPKSSIASAPSAKSKASRAENAFTLMSYLAIPFLAVLLLMQTGAGLFFPSVYFPGEVTIVATYKALAQSGQWLLPSVSELLGETIGETPRVALFATLPGHYWFLYLVQRIPVDTAFFLPLAACLSAFVALAGTYTLGICAGLGRRISFAGGLILLSCLAFAPLARLVGPDTLLAGLLAFSLACLCRGFMQERAYLWLALGFVLAGFATLVGGLIGLWLPVLGSGIFMLWRGTLRRAHGLDAVTGFTVLLCGVLGWVGAGILLGGESAQGLGPLTQQLFAPFASLMSPSTPSWPLGDAWWLSLLILLIGLLPWITVVFFVAWGRVLGSGWSSMTSSRKNTTGVAWLWISLVLGFVFFILNSPALSFAVVSLLPVAALLLAKALLNLSAKRSRIFYAFVAALFTLAGVGLAALALPAVAAHAERAHALLAPYIPAHIWGALLATKGLPLLGGMSVLAGLVVYRFTDRAYPAGALAVCVLLTMILVQPATFISGTSMKDRIAVELPEGMGLGRGIDTGTDGGTP